LVVTAEQAAVAEMRIGLIRLPGFHLVAAVPDLVFGLIRPRGFHLVEAAVQVPGPNLLFKQATLAAATAMELLLPEKSPEPAGCRRRVLEVLVLLSVELLVALERLLLTANLVES
jgi:hypothetical protein